MRTLILRLRAFGEDMDDEGRAVRPDDLDRLVDVVDRDDGHDRCEDFAEKFVRAGRRTKKTIKRRRAPNSPLHQRILHIDILHHRRLDPAIFLLSTRHNLPLRPSNQPFHALLRARVHSRQRRRRLQRAIGVELFVRLLYGGDEGVLVPFTGLSTGERDLSRDTALGLILNTGSGSVSFNRKVRVIRVISFTPLGVSHSNILKATVPNTLAAKER